MTKKIIGGKAFKNIDKKLDIEKLKEFEKTTEEFVFSEFNLAGWDLETIALFSRRMQTALAESMRDPELLIESIEAARQTLSASVGVIPKNRIEKLDRKLENIQEMAINLIVSLRAQGLKNNEIFLNKKYRELRERVRKLITEVNNWRGKYGLSIPTRVRVSDQMKIIEALEDL